MFTLIDNIVSIKELYMSYMLRLIQENLLKTLKLINLHANENIAKYEINKVDLTRCSWS